MLQEREMSLNKREEKLNQMESRLVRMKGLSAHKGFQEIKLKYDAEISQLIAQLKDKSREFERIKSAFSSTRKTNLGLKKEASQRVLSSPCSVDGLSCLANVSLMLFACLKLEEKNAKIRRLEEQNFSLTNRLVNAQVKRNRSSRLVFSSLVFVCAC